VDLDVSWSGATLLARDMKRRYLGLALKVDVVIQVPHEQRVLAYTLRAQPAESLNIDWSTLPAGQKDDAFVYDTMIMSSLEETGTKVASVLLAPVPNAPRL